MLAGLLSSSVGFVFGVVGVVVITGGPSLPELLLSNVAVDCAFVAALRAAVSWFSWPPLSWVTMTEVDWAVFAAPWPEPPSISLMTTEVDWPLAFEPLLPLPLPELPPLVPPVPESLAVELPPDPPLPPVSEDPVPLPEPPVPG